MANQPIHNPKDYSETLRQLETTDPAHPDTFNPLFEGLINNDAYLKEKQDEQAAQMADYAKRIGSVGTKKVDESNIHDNYTLRYNAKIDQLVYVENKIDRIPPAPATNISAKEDDQSISITYTSPTDSDYMGTRLVYKAGGYPVDINDGTVIGNYISGTAITGLINETKYYFRLFTYDTSSNYNEDKNQQLTATPTFVKIYGVKIDTTNSNPKTALTYTDNAVGFTPARGNNGSFNYGSWEDIYPFNEIKPCLFKDGEVNYYLKPDDYTKKINGSSADVTSGADGDVMIEFPKIWWKFERIGTDLYVKYATKQVDNTWKCLAHKRGNIEKEKIYISAYMGYYTGGKLRSLSGKTPTTEKTIGKFRDYAQANGNKYEQMAYYQLLMLQVLFIIMFKNRDSQTALGRGYVDGNDSSTTTGETNQKGLFYGSTNGSEQNKFCGIEDFWGNVRYWIDGFYCDSNRNILITNSSFNDTGSGYTNYGQGATDNISGYINQVQGTTETGFVIKSDSGSSSTYYSDCGCLYASSLPSFGGRWSSGSNAGAFRLNVDYSASFAYSAVGGRLLAL